MENGYNNQAVTINPSIQWRYSPNRALAFTVFPKNVLSLAASFQLRQQKNLAASCCTTSSHLFLGFPTDLTATNLSHNK
jgi:hypothetical protein